MRHCTRGESVCVGRTRALRLHSSGAYAAAGLQCTVNRNMGLWGSGCFGVSGVLCMIAGWWTSVGKPGADGKAGPAGKDGKDGKDGDALLLL